MSTKTFLDVPAPTPVRITFCGRAAISTGVLNLRILMGSANYYLVESTSKDPEDVEHSDLFVMCSSEGVPPGCFRVKEGGDYWVSQINPNAVVDTRVNDDLMEAVYGVSVGPSQEEAKRAKKKSKMATAASEELSDDDTLFDFFSGQQKRGNKDDGASPPPMKPSQRRLPKRKTATETTTALSVTASEAGTEGVGWGTLELQEEDAVSGRKRARAGVDTTALLTSLQDGAAMKSLEKQPSKPQQPENVVSEAARKKLKRDPATAITTSSTDASSITNTGVKYTSSANSPQQQEQQSQPRHHNHHHHHRASGGENETEGVAGEGEEESMSRIAEREARREEKRTRREEKTEKRARKEEKRRKKEEKRLRREERMALGVRGKSSVSSEPASVNSAAAAEGRSSDHYHPHHYPTQPSQQEVDNEKSAAATAVLRASGVLSATATPSTVPQNVQQMHAAAEAERQFGVAAYVSAPPTPGFSKHPSASPSVGEPVEVGATVVPGSEAATGKKTAHKQTKKASKTAVAATTDTEAKKASVVTLVGGWSPAQLQAQLDSVIDSDKEVATPRDDKKTPSKNSSPALKASGVTPNESRSMPSPPAKPQANLSKRKRPALPSVTGSDQSTNVSPHVAPVAAAASHALAGTPTMSRNSPHASPATMIAAEADRARRMVSDTLQLSKSIGNPNRVQQQSRQGSQPSPVQPSPATLPQDSPALGFTQVHNSLAEEFSLEPSSSSATSSEYLYDHDD